MKDYRVNIAYQFIITADNEDDACKIAEERLFSKDSVPLADYQASCFSCGEIDEECSCNRRSK